MFYIINDKSLREAQIHEIDEKTIVVGYLTLEELRDNISRLNISDSVLTDCMSEQTRFRNSIDAYDDFSFGIINIMNVMNPTAEKDRIAFIIKRNQFFLIKLIDENDSCRDMFENALKKYKQNATLEKIIFGILDKLVPGGNEYLEITENKIMEMEQSLINGIDTRDLNKDIFTLRRELSSLMNYYEQLYNIGEELQANQNDLFDEDDLRYFKIFTDKAGRLSHNINGMCENLIHIREALDAALNYNLNRIMKIFTVVTTIFLPLTLIVGWYGMNFENMPELSWVYGYPMVIGLSVLVVFVCILLFKRKRFV